MLKNAIALFIALFSLSAYAQIDSMQSIMLRGIDYSDRGEYELSLVEFYNALNLAPKNAWVNYEIALAHYYLGNKNRSEKFAKIAAKETSENGLQAIILLGAIYDDRGEHKKSIKTYQDGMKTFGDYYLLWYNLGVTAHTMRDYELAEKAFINAINNKIDNASSHYALASTMMSQNRRVEALLPLYFFLLLEPDSDRSEMAYTDIVRLMQRGVKSSRSEDGKLVIEMRVQNPEDQQSTIGESDMFLSLLQASNSNLENQDKSEFELQKLNAQRFFNHLGEANGWQKINKFYTDYYIPFFYAISKSQHFEGFANYTAQSAYSECKTWVAQHTFELEEFFDWLDQQNLEPNKSN